MQSIEEMRQASQKTCIYGVQSSPDECCRNYWLILFSPVSPFNDQRTIRVCSYFSHVFLHLFRLNPYTKE